MKKIIHIAFATILAGLAISCQKENTLTEQNDAPVQYTFNIAVNDKAGFDDDASTKGSGPSYKTGWESGDRIFLFFKPTSGSLLTDTYATLTYKGSSWEGTVTGSTSLGNEGTLSAVYVYNLGSNVKPVFSDSKWTIATGNTNTFYSCHTKVSYSVSGNNEISASLSLAAPADFVQFYVKDATGVLTCDQVKGWKDIAIGSEMTFSNVTCTLYMVGFENSGDSEVREYYGRIVNDGKSLKDVACEFSVANNGKVYEHTATPTTDARSFKMSITGDKAWTEAEEKLPGLFTVGKGKDGKAGTADDVQVRFSKGNLLASIDANGVPTDWKFAANQYAYLGEGGANKTIGTAAGDVDLFGWSTDSTIYGINTSTSKSTYYGDFQDWGIAYCKKKSIADGAWRTLTKDEWVYLINKADNDNVRKGKYKFGVTVCGKTNCLILVPDNIEMDINASYEGFTWSVAQAFGLVCLPAAGYRYGSDVNQVGDYGFYWSSTAHEDNIEAYGMKFKSDSVTPDSYEDARYEGHSVRLVTELK